MAEDLTENDDERRRYVEAFANGCRFAGYVELKRRVQDDVRLYLRLTRQEFLDRLLDYLRNGGRLSKVTEKRDMANKPFPWMCGECGRAEVRPKAIEYKGEIKHDGKLYEVRIDNLEVPTCGHCGEQWFDIETDKQINAALRKTIGLLQPEEVRKRRKALDLTQKDLAEKIGVAVASLSRWENGSSIQARSTDKLLRMFFSHPDDPVWLGDGHDTGHDDEVPAPARGVRGG